jgi:hypothetical protein
VATEAAWLNGNNLEKEETKKKKEKRDKMKEKTLTLTGLLMEGLWRGEAGARQVFGRGNLLQQWGQNKEQGGAEKRCARNREHPGPHNLTRDAPAHGG